MSLKLTKQEIVSLFEAQKAGLITSDTLQKIILSAAQGDTAGGNEEAPKQTWQGRDIYSMDGNALCQMVLAEVIESLRSYSPSNRTA